MFSARIFEKLDGVNGVRNGRKTAVSFGSMTKTVLPPLSPATTPFNPFGIPAQPPVCRRNKCQPGRSRSRCDPFMRSGRFTVRRQCDRYERTGVTRFCFFSESKCKICHCPRWQTAPTDFVVAKPFSDLLQKNSIRSIPAIYAPFDDLLTR